MLTREELERLSAEAEKKIAPLRQAVEADPGNAENHRQLGRALHEGGYQQEAVLHLERAAELAPGVRTLLDLTVGYSGAARLDDAERTSKRLLEMAPDFSIPLHNLGTLAHRRGEYDEAIGYFNQALEKEPEYMLARLHLGDSLRSSGRLQEAYRAYESVLELEPQNPREANNYIDAFYKLAALDVKMGAHQRAASLLTELIKLAPDHNRAHYAYGQVLLHLGRPEEAQRSFDRHVEILAKEESRSPAAMGD
ncbi:MAG: tetratricopeptide repeat protein [Acidobacteria bacterium]|nr:tetratricopeptide repeat protein [Acidobacteriota bacterium]NIM62304.1 tetratricopeptide repeat protein [Acidobacteriota bacterium]NIO58245.1 tetratricopeptide repeat protein [Acidobacteriota bacterium]NIQ29274.1 tetratricopeptide repeat protein [Acidobacteriota bacterium]NIQ83873.1 tetratricopeptide repeat protein [Acidobacteriota bacterium]